MQCDIALLCSDLLRCSLSFTLYNIVLLVPSASPHIKVILPPNSTTLGGHVNFIHFLCGQGGYQFQKLKSFSIIIIKLSWKINLYSILVFITVTVPYPNLTWLTSSFGVKLDNGVGPNAPRSPP